LDSVEEANREIVRQVDSLENMVMEDVESPISVSLDLQRLKQSENPEERSLADLLAAISEVRSSILSIEKAIGNPENLLPPPYVRQLFERYSGCRIPPHILFELREIADRLSANLLPGHMKSRNKQQECEAMLRRLRRDISMLLHEQEF